MSGLYYGLIIFLVILVIYMIATLNSIINLEKHVERSKSVVDVFLKKRYDLIPNLVECVKGYTTHEEETLKKIVDLRNNYLNNNTEETEKDLKNEFVKLIGIAESYPDLKASEQFLNLQKNLSKVESEIGAARRIYINDITAFNTKVESFPASIIAALGNYKVKTLPTYDYDEVIIKF